MKALLFALLAAASTAATAQSVAITGGKLVLGDGSAPIEGGTVVITNGRVVAAGKGVAVPAGAEVVDARGKWVTPGIVAGFTRLGLAGVDAVAPSNDTRARTSPFSASIDIAPAINPDVEAIGITRAAGVTRAIVSPEMGSGIFAGQGAVIDTAIHSVGRAVTKPRAFQFVEFGEEGARAAGGSRTAWFATFKNAMYEARNASQGIFPDQNQLKRADALALVPVLNGTTKLLIHVEGANDMLSLIDMKRDYPLIDMVFVGATEGWRVAKQVAAARIPVIASALNDLPAAFDQIAATQSNVGRMKAAGVNVAIGMIDDNDTRQAQQTMQMAGNLVALTRVPGASGLNWNQAFAAISSKPAEIIGMGAEIGSLRPGRRGDVVIWDGDPLELTTGVSAVWIDGVRQSRETRQTRLRARYTRPSEGDLPKAFDR